MPLPPSDQAALHLAFRLALLDALPSGDTEARRAALTEARDRLAGYLLVDKESPDLPAVLRAVKERAILATALQSAFEEAWRIVSAEAGK